MNERTGYQIPAQMSYQNIAQQEKLKPLLRERLEAQVTEYSPEEEINVDVDTEVPDSREEKYTTSKRRHRNSAFASRVKKIYDYQCAFCGAERYTPNGNPEVEAAHIKPVSEGGPDHPKNGIALCRLHHWAFDNGWLEITEDLEVKVNGPEDRPEHEEFEKMQGRKINLPEKEELRPAERFL
jgi:putative restriction endonuclease